ncbi:hypothetical protein KFE25_002183 [Diacronema lutheri]|uniref:Exostosin GT47 domain-containing protein n=1 Tax=Diacronema lutheri TaxID=2081491 RepID=A0A8J5XQC8_DIALT|nr:hypothetical protein KFE25_002183 [Diacronema lutheri]
MRRGRGARALALLALISWRNADALVYRISEFLPDVCALASRKPAKSRGTTASAAAAAQRAAEQPRMPSELAAHLHASNGTLPSLTQLAPYVLSMEAIYGSGTLCPGSRTDDLPYLAVDEAPVHFCVDLPQLATSMGSTAAYFDQFATERVMLSRWMQIAPSCGPTRPPEAAAADGCASCAAPPAAARACEADVVVVPSLALHCHLRHGFRWAFHTWLKRREEQIGYWSAIRALYHDGRRRPPTIVVHDSFVFSAYEEHPNLQALAHQPAAFAARVIRASIESNLAVPSADGLLRQWYLYRYPRTFVDGAEPELARRRAELARGEFFSYAMNVPILVTLPVPTGARRAVRWHGGGGGGRGGGSDRAAPRDIAILLSGERGRNVNALDRLAAFDALEAAGASCTSKGCVLCMPGAEGCEARSAHMYAQVAASVFCIEPSGDTLTRSHFYVALLAGCVPVIFDGVHRAFADSNFSAQTWWPWRAGAARDRSPPHGLDYRKFAVVLSAQDLGSRGWVDELVRAAASGRARHLQLELDRVSHLFAYARAPCGGVGGASLVCDAFSQFLAFIGRAHAVGERVGALLA